MSKLGPSPIHP